ncbi:MAG: thiamine phosphate synthase [Rikenellaceae bacterium]
MSNQDFGLCVIITAPKLSYTEVAEVCVRCGVRYLQLREKHLSDRDILSAADEILAVTRGTETLFVMNDRADLALLAGADMLHLGQDDISIEAARTILGDMPIGLSTHSLAQAREAIAKSPRYIGFGPIYATTTKANPDPTVGTDLLRELMGELGDDSLPVIAIGGIFPENVECVVSAGARNICLVRHLMESATCQELERKIKELQQQL